MMKGQIEEQQGNKDAAREAYNQGVCCDDGSPLVGGGYNKLGPWILFQKGVAMVSVVFWWDFHLVDINNKSDR